jgi:hypothetical protein
MRRPLVIFSIVGVVLALIFRGSALHNLLLFFAALLFVGPRFVVLVLVGMISFVNRTTGLPERHVTWIVLLYLGGLLFLASTASFLIHAVIVTLVVSLDVFRHRTHLSQAYTRMLIVVGVAGGAILVSGGLGHAIRIFHVSAAEKYVLRATPVLDEMKKRDGKFPDSLPVEVLGRPPYLLRSSAGYFSNGLSFHFGHPAAIRLFDDTWIFSSKTRRWGLYDGEALGNLAWQEQRP